MEGEHEYEYEFSEYFDPRERCPKCDILEPWINFGLPNSTEQFCKKCGYQKGRPIEKDKTK
jgi:hypothetical protein